MSKYIIKNCPSCTKKDECIAMYLRTSVDCKERTDCVLKQIVQMCNEYSDKWEDCDFSNGLSDEIFKLLDIQEVE